MRKPGIYKIQSKLFPNRIYIGSAVDFKSRWQLHLSDLAKNKHHSGKLQNHVNKYGIDDLIFVLIEPCFPHYLITREQYYIDTLIPYFNVCKKAGSCLGRKISDQQKKRLSELRMGKKTGPCSEERKRAISMGNKGLKRTLAQRKNFSEKAKGRKWSEESKLKASKTHTGVKRPPYIGRKIGEANKNRTYSMETRLKLSMAAKDRIRNKNPLLYGIRLNHNKFNVYLYRMGKALYGGRYSVLSKAIKKRDELEDKIN